MLDRQKLGVSAAASSVTSGPLSQVFVIVPVFTPSRDQRARSRWVLQAQEGFVGILDDRELPETTAGHVQYATRLRGTFKGADVSLSYFDGYDTTPVLRQATVSAGFFAVPGPNGPEARRITLGMWDDARREVTGGLSPGDRVLLRSAATP